MSDLDIDEMERRAQTYVMHNFGGNSWGFPGDVLTLIARVRELEGRLKTVSAILERGGYA